MAGNGASYEKMCGFWSGGILVRLLLHTDYPMQLNCGVFER